MNNHLIYVTYGEESSSVYTTQVIELLNNWSKRPNWKVTLVQISFSEMFSELREQVEKIHIKRKHKFLFKTDTDKYIKEIKSQINFNNNDKMFFNSRGIFAYTISTSFLNKYNINSKINNLDNRGVTEEFKYSFRRYLLYYIMDWYKKKVVRKATSITTVSNNLKRNLITKYNLKEYQINIKVIPTLSIMQYKSTSDIKKDILYIGKVAWVSKKEFKKHIIVLNNIFKKKNWRICIIGNPHPISELQREGTVFLPRMKANELYNRVSNFHSGLIVRDTSIVNKVSAPCKVSDYLCLGLPVIYAGEIGSIIDFLKKYPETKPAIINIEELKESPEVFSSFVNISDKQRKELSEKAESFFGINSVVDRYIDFFVNEFNQITDMNK